GPPALPVWLQAPSDSAASDIPARLRCCRRESLIRNSKRNLPVILRLCVQTGKKGELPAHSSLRRKQFCSHKEIQSEIPHRDGAMDRKRNSWFRDGASLQFIRKRPRQISRGEPACLLGCYIVEGAARF